MKNYNSCLKIISLIALGSLMSLNAMAQKDSISKYFSEMEDDRSNTVITISGMMFNLFKNLEVEDQEDRETLEAMSKLTGLKILSKDEMRDGFTFYKNAMKRLPAGQFEEWMTIREKDQDVSFMIKKEGNKISELIMFSGSEDSFFMMSIVGDIDMSQISKISKSLDIEGMDDLEKAEKKKN